MTCSLTSLSWRTWDIASFLRECKIRSLASTIRDRHRAGASATVPCDRSVFGNVALALRARLSAWAKAHPCM